MVFRDLDNLPGYEGNCLNALLGWPQCLDVSGLQSPDNLPGCEEAGRRSRSHVSEPAAYHRGLDSGGSHWLVVSDAAS